VKELLRATKGRLVKRSESKHIRGISIDSRTIKPGEAFIAIKGNNFDGHNFIEKAIKKGARCIIKEAKRGKCKTGKINFIEVKDTQKALGDIARFQRKRFDIPVIAVTGSSGKTTTKEMIAWVLSKKYKVLKNQGTKNNQIGLPMTLLTLNGSYEVAVLEIGTNHFGEVDYLSKICLANIGIITDIGPVHLEYLHNLEGVFREKYTLIKNLKKPYIAILNSDGFMRNKTIKKSIKPFIIGVGIKNQNDFLASEIKILNSRIEFLANQKYKFTLNTLGYYNIYNALIAIAVARIFGLGYRSIASRLSGFDFPQSRLKLMTLNKIRFIDDTYNSNPVSLKQALDTLGNLKASGRKIFVMGDMLELGNNKKLFHLQAGRQVAKICDTFITVGELSKLAAEAAKNAGFDTKKIFTCASCDQARSILFNKVFPSQDDIVLVKGSRLMKMEEIFKNK
ncbi:MAG: UDP-N-acetylmuramoyl-tripeptide--D-alanyl-D-alanine ligase, partial [Candidatus Omnitrophica bacterium]|nr:UDP-N-acetylmuramoyl-tripeptide--D-alanyl-D-alanine ligase [Candidatus Omnitrophota bacterium]